jgi:hypothetical protein
VVYIGPEFNLKKLNDLEVKGAVSSENHRQVCGVGKLE